MVEGARGEDGIGYDVGAVDGELVGLGLPPGVELDR